MQFDDAGRGFSFQHDGPLDMRMSDDGMTAADFVNEAEEEDIANVIYTFGEEHKSRSIARAIVRRRAETPFTRTLELADTVSRVFHGRKIDGRHPATRTFQALRIYVNDELGELAGALSAALRRFESDTWPRVARGEHVTMSPLRQALAEALRISEAAKCRMVRNQRALYDLIR